MNLISIWKEKNKILEGILNYVFKHQDIEDVVIERQLVCNTCEHLDNKGSQCVVYGTGPCCSLCGCSLKFKLRSMASECPDKRWEAMMNEEEEDLLNKQL